MRLVDLVADARERWAALDDGGRRFVLAGPADYADAVRAVPLRLVCTDPLTAACASLGYAEGDRLVSCLDLLRVPARSVWVEWLDGAKLAALRGLGVLAAESATGSARRAGVLITADETGRRGELRTFWSADGPDGPVPHAAAFITTFDFDRPYGDVPDWQEAFVGGHVSACFEGRRDVSELLDHVRFRFEPSWLRYYATAALAPAQRRDVVSRCAATVATDAPLLMALLLFLNARDGVQRTRPDLARLNQARARKGRTPLLEHVELALALPDQAHRDARDAGAGATRAAPRLHHVRGHLVRREDRVFWRSPHLRGTARAGIVQSRTLTLHYGPRPSGERRTA